MSAPGECFLRDTLRQPQWLCLESVSHSVHPLIPQLNKVSCSQDDELLAERWVSSQDGEGGGGTWDHFGGSGHPLVLPPPKKKINIYIYITKKKKKIIIIIKKKLKLKKIDR